jgi:nucleoside-diphosphate-sugar epimerase
MPPSVLEARGCVLFPPLHARDPLQVTGTTNVVEACKAQGVRALVFTSSASVVFDGKDQSGVGEELPIPANLTCVGWRGLCAVLAGF